jgi:uncharacterized protein YjbI with pentapeptide repeats
MTKDEIAEVLREHTNWRADATKGKRAYLRGANLAGAYLNRAYLNEANLAEANLAGADLHGAYLYGANLAGANLHGAYLYGANLAGANLYGANLAGADLRGVHHVIALGQPDGWWGHAYMWDGEIWVRIGCRTKSLSDGRAYWSYKEDRREVLAALDYAETISRLRGWEVKDA